MNKLRFTLWVSICFWLHPNIQAQNHLPTKSNPATYVNDFRNFLKEPEAEKLENKLKEYHGKLSTDIILVTIESLQGHDINQYAEDLVRQWNIENNVLILISNKEQQLKIRVSKDLEDEITSSQITEIIDTQMNPHFQQGNFYQGFAQGIEALASKMDSKTTSYQPNGFPPKPDTATYVNDFAGFMGSTQIKKLEDKLRTYKDSTSTQIVIVTVKNLAEKDIKAYSIHLASEWGIGQKGADNGLLILASEEERKVRIEVGYGLEAKITDALAKKIINKQITPNFKDGYFYRGFEEATNVIISALAGEVFETKSTESTETYTPYEKDYSETFTLIVGIVGFLIICTILYWLSTRANIKDMLARIKERLEPEKWEKLKQTYKPQEVEDKYQEFRAKFKKLFKILDTVVDKFNLKLWEVLEYPEKYFSKREDAYMISLGKQALSAFENQEVFEASERQKMKAKIESTIEKFNIKSCESLTEADFVEIQQHRELYQNIYNNPYDFFEIDYDFVKSELDKIKTADFWEQYQEKFTPRSIQKTQVEFERKYEKIFAIENLESRQGSMLTFYRNAFTSFLETPSAKLDFSDEYLATVRASYTDSSTYSSSSSYSDSSSSSYSYSDSSYSDYSDYSDSYSDFGGGSFGGGGADGSW